MKIIFTATIITSTIQNHTAEDPVRICVYSKNGTVHFSVVTLNHWQSNDQNCSSPTNDYDTDNNNNDNNNINNNNNKY